MTGPASGRLRLATRGSPQALTQARVVADALAVATGHDAELVPIKTTGDRERSVPLHTIGGQGVFVKEIQQAVLDGRADFAVHSAKDLPSETPAGLVIGAFCARAVMRPTRSSAERSPSCRRVRPSPPGRSAAGRNSASNALTSCSSSCAATSPAGSTRFQRPVPS